jgi:hypothetical protein
MMLPEEWIARTVLIFTKRSVGEFHLFAECGMVSTASSIGNLSLPLFWCHWTGG